MFFGRWGRNFRTDEIAAVHVRAAIPKSAHDVYDKAAVLVLFFISICGLAASTTKITGQKSASCCCFACVGHVVL